jgi:hypothetical protein
MSLRRRAQVVLGLSREKAIRAAFDRLQRNPSFYLVSGLVLPAIAAFLLGSAFQVPAPPLSRSVIGTLWQVEAALIGLAIALAVYGYESLSRSGSIEPRELEYLRLPRAIYLGIALVVLTGAAFVGGYDEVLADSTQARSLTAWLAVAAVGVSCWWIAILVRALPEAVRVSNPSYRTEMRIALLVPLATQAVEQRLIELASGNLLSRMASASSTTWAPWLSLTGAEDRSHLLRASSAGYVWDINVRTLGHVFAALPGARMTGQIATRVDRDQVLAVCPSRPDGRTLRAWAQTFLIKSESSSEILDEIIDGLRDSAFQDLGTRPNAVKEVLDAYANCLEIFAAKWQLHAGRMELEQLREGLSSDRTPLGRIVEAVDTLMEKAIAIDAADSIGDLGFFPARIARIGVQNSSTAYLSAFDLNLRWYWLGSRRSGGESERVKGSWTYVTDFIQWMLPIMGRGYGRDVDRDLVRVAERAARSTLVGVARAMFVSGDLTQFDALAGRLAAIRDDDD